MRFLLVLIFTFQFIIIVSAQRHTFSGTVTDASNGETLIGANVSVVELPGKGITTNAYGYFSLTLPDGEYHSKFRTWVISKTTKRKVVANRQINFKLEPNSTELQITYYCTTRNSISLLPNWYGKIEVKEISKIPVIFGEADILKTLKLTPGIKICREAGGGFFVRGGNISQNLFYSMKQQFIKPTITWFFFQP
jgi:hypothetical protein